MTLAPYLDLIRFNRPVGWLVLYWPTMISLFVAADGWPGWHLFVVFSLGVFLTRSAGCAINDYADRHWDGQVERTQQRPLVTGALTAKQALGCFAALMLIAFGLVLTLNIESILASLVAVALAALYPFTKRWTHYPQLFLGLAFSMGVIMPFIALDRPLNWVVWLLWLANILWTLGYDTLYALTDMPDDLKAGIKSTAIAFGEKAHRVVAGLQASALILWGTAGIFSGLSFPYALGLAIAANLFLNQHKLIASRRREDYFAAFVSNHRVGLVILAGLLLDLIYQSQKLT